MNDILPLFTAFWLGILTSVSPCPLATNVAAISLLSRRIDSRARAFAGALAYTLGRVFVYTVLALFLMVGFVTMPAMSEFLRNGLHPYLGPLLILTGMALVGWLPLPVEFSFANSERAESLSKWGVFGEFLLGCLFALSFCPVTAALFFGSLIPLSLQYSMPPVPVMLYGFGTALPVGLIAMLIVFSTKYASVLLGKIQSIQKILVYTTGSILIITGIYLTLKSFI